MPFLLRRIFETFFVSVLVSSVVMILLTAELIPSTRLVVLIASVLSAIVFLLVSIGNLHRHIFAVRDSAAYFRVNCTAFVLYVFVTLWLIFDRHGTILAWGFLPVKFLEAFGIKTIISALILYFLLFLNLLPVYLDYVREMRYIQKMEGDEESC